MTQRAERQPDVDALEHESGLRPLGEYPDHCARCRRRADQVARQAACEHSSWTEVRSWGGEIVIQVCDMCGLGAKDRDVDDEESAATA